MTGIADKTQTRFKAAARKAITRAAIASTLVAGVASSVPANASAHPSAKTTATTATPHAPTNKNYKTLSTAPKALKPVFTNPAIAGNAKRVNTLLKVWDMTKDIGFFGPEYPTIMAAYETKGVPSAVNEITGAKTLYQYTPRMLAALGIKDPTNVQETTQKFVRYTADNFIYLYNKLEREPSIGEGISASILGKGPAAVLAKGATQHPTMKAGDLLAEVYKNERINRITLSMENKHSKGEINRAIRNALPCIQKTSLAKARTDLNNNGINPNQTCAELHTYFENLHTRLAAECGLPATKTANVKSLAQMDSKVFAAKFGKNLRQPKLNDIDARQIMVAKDTETKAPAISTQQPNTTKPSVFANTKNFFRNTFNASI